MLRLGCGLAVVLWLVAPAGANEPFGQETVEVRPWRHPSETKPRHRHNHSAEHAHSPGRTHPAGSSRGHKPERQTRSHDGDRHGHDDEGVETEHLFGFTMGSDIDPPGHRHVIADLDGRFGKGAGSYAAVSKQLEYAFTPWRDFHVGLGAAFAAHRISGVQGLEDVRQGTFEGVSLELRQRFLDRKQAPFGLTLTAEPHWARVDEVSGERAKKFGVGFNLAADQELVKDWLYGAINLTYEPEWVRIRSTGESERASSVGASGALMFQVIPSVLVGGEVRYLRAYEGAALNTFAGEAMFLGPILYANVTSNVALVAAYSGQVTGRPADGSAKLDLQNFERHRARLKAVISF